EQAADFSLAADLVIHLHVPVGRDSIVRKRRQVVQCGVAVGWVGNQLLNCQGNWIHASGRNNVARKSSLHNLSVHGLRRLRIVNRAGAEGIAKWIRPQTAAGEGTREVARAIGCRRHGDGGVVDNKEFAVLLAVEEKESTVPAVVDLRYPDRTADVKAVVVAPDADR